MARDFAQVAAACILLASCGGARAEGPPAIEGDGVSREPAGGSDRSVGLVTPPVGYDACESDAECVVASINPEARDCGSPCCQEAYAVNRRELARRVRLAETTCAPIVPSLTCVTDCMLIDHSRCEAGHCELVLPP